MKIEEHNKLSKLSGKLITFQWKINRVNSTINEQLIIVRLTNSKFSTNSDYLYI